MALQITRFHSTIDFFLLGNLKSKVHVNLIHRVWMTSRQTCVDLIRPTVLESTVLRYPMRLLDNSLTNNSPKKVEKT